VDKLTPAPFLGLLISLTMGALGVFTVWLGGGAIPPPGVDASLRTIVVIVGILTVAPSLVTLGLVPRAISEDVLGAGPYHPVAGDGRPSTGTVAVQELATILHRTLAGGPYRVLTAKRAVRVEWNTDDPRLRSLLAAYVAPVVFRTTLGDAGPGKYLRQDELLHFDSVAGRLVACSPGAGQSEAITEVNIAAAPGGLDVSAVPFLNAKEVEAAVDSALELVHVRPATPATDRMSLVYGIAGGLIALIVIVTLIVTFSRLH
jgi:hypothetical protein